MNKAKLVISMLGKTALMKKDCKVAVNAIIASIEEALVNGEKVTLVGFGTFSLFNFINIPP